MTLVVVPSRKASWQQRTWRKEILPSTRKEFLLRKRRKNEEIQAASFYFFYRDDSILKPRAREICSLRRAHYESYHNGP